MRFLADRSKDKRMTDPIMAINKHIQKAKEEGTLKINATLGMLFDDEGCFLTFPSVKETIDAIPPADKYTYAPVDGGKNYHEAVKSWVFGKERERLEKNFHIGITAAAGGTGAISNTFSNYLDEGEAILAPDIAWVYKRIAAEFGIHTETYPLFDDKNRFHMEALKKKATEIAQKQKKLLLVMNDPCHNPTGYSLRDEEWEELIDHLNKIAEENIPIILLHDIAYLDYDPRGREKSRKAFGRYTAFHENILPIIAFSGSKTFGLYGLRIGAQIALSKKKGEIEAFRHATQVSSRAKWSNAPKIGIALVQELLHDKEKTETFQKELQEAASVLAQRGERFMKKAKEENIPHHPYTGGFFVTVPLDDPEKKAEELKKKGIFVVAKKDLIRIALSAVTPEDIDVLIDELR